MSDTLDWVEAQAYLRGERGRTLVDSQGDTWSVRVGQIGFTDDKGTWVPWEVRWAPRVTFSRPAPVAPSKPRVTRIDVRQHPDSKWSSSFITSGPRIFTCCSLVRPPSVAEVESSTKVMLRPGEPLPDFSDAFTIVTPYREPVADFGRRVHEALGRDYGPGVVFGVDPGDVSPGVLVIDSYTAPRPRPRVTRIDVAELCDGRNWSTVFHCASRVHWHIRPRYDVADIARLYPDFDFSDAFTIVTPYVRSSP